MANKLHGTYYGGYPGIKPAKHVLLEAGKESITIYQTGFFGNKKAVIGEIDYTEVEDCQFKNTVVTNMASLRKKNTAGGIEVEIKTKKGIFKVVNDFTMINVGGMLQGTNTTSSLIADREAKCIVMEIMSHKS